MTRSILTLLSLMMMSSFASAQADIEGSWAWVTVGCESGTKTPKSSIVEGQIAFLGGKYSYQTRLVNPFSPDLLALKQRAVQNAEEAIATMAEGAEKQSAQAQVLAEKRSLKELSKAFIDVRVSGTYQIDGHQLKTTTTEKNGVSVQGATKANDFSIDGIHLTLKGAPQKDDSGMCPAGDRVVTVFERM